MKMFSNIYRMAALCLMTVIAFAVNAQDAHIALRTNPSGIGYIYCSSQNSSEYLYDGDTLHAQVGTTIYLSVSENLSWIFTNVTDENGQVVTTETYTVMTLQNPGQHVYTANFAFHPANPGHLPLGHYDSPSQTLTLESVCNDGSSPSEGKYSSSLLQDFLAMVTRYNLPDMWGGDNMNANPVETLKLVGCADGSLDCYSIFARLGNVRTVDYSGLSGYTNVYNYDLNGADSVETVILPNNVESVGSYYFDYAGIMLTDVYLPVVTPPSLSLNADSFMVWDHNASTNVARYYHEIKLHVPAQSLSAYQAHPSWSKFWLVPIAGTTASITVQGINSWLMDGSVLTLSASDGASLRKTINKDSVNYVFSNLEKNKPYNIGLASADGRYVLAEPISGLMLNGDTVVTMQMRAFGRTFAHVVAGEQNVTDQCVCTWLDSLGTTAFGSGTTSPLYPIGDSLRLRVVPMGEIGTYFESQEVGYRMEPSSNGVWVDLERKDIGNGNTDTVRIATGALHVIALTDASQYVGMIFDETGNLSGKYSFVSNSGAQYYDFLQEGLLPGDYSLVVIQDGPYATAFRYDQFAQMDLVANTDYAYYDFRIAGDSISEIVLQSIPEVNANASHIVESSFTANKAEVMASNSVLLTAEVEFVADDMDNISDLVYYIDLPDNLTVEEGSVMIGNNSVTYSFYNGRLSVSAGMANLASKEATRLRFYVIPTAPGFFYPSASVEYRYRNNLKSEPVGNAYFEAKAITITAPAVTLQPTFEATGYAPSLSLVKIVTAQGDTIGSAYSNRIGFYHADCTIPATTTTTYVIHAFTGTQYASRLVSDTTVVRYDADALRPNDCFMTHFNNWYHRPMDITWNFSNCVTSATYYYYYHAEEFTFRTNMSGATDSVNFVVVGMDGSKTVIPATLNGGFTWVASMLITTNKMPVRVDISYRYAGEMYYFQSCRSVQPIADPSGYVYEGVSSNRIEGVTASAYYKADLDSAEVLWDAEPYDQVNPQQTDYAGAYGWDVPKGWWQVRFAKTGYEPAKTEWLPVPPPQIEINVPIVRKSAPVVRSISAFEDAVNIEFDRYMLPEDMTSEMITVTDGTNPINGSFTLTDKEVRTAGDTVAYVSKIKFVPAGTLAGNITVNFDTCRSYAGVPMAPTSQQAAVALEVKNFGQIDTVFLTVGETYQRVIYALPMAAAAGKTMRFDNMGSSLYSISTSSVVIASDGSAPITFTPQVQGNTVLHVSVDGTDLEAYIPVVIAAPTVPVGPTAVTTLPAEEDLLSAEKFVREGVIYIRLNGEVFTTTGVRVE